uniref:Immunoglobulin like and fibronectin type III domain containing 1, tandem duplicate 1 n=1 Tax=Labrus bergylta TaxID=56723 RepID=A0A3Q3GFD5_9LABR
MWKKSKVTDQTAAGQAIKKKSKVPGVMITQFIEELPEDMSTPDFTRKPIALTIQEKLAVFKAIVVGNPTPTVTWSRANGEIHFHPDMCEQKYDDTSREHTIEFPKVAPEDADTYKCFATNEYGRAVCTVVLNVIEEEKVWEILMSADKKDYEHICCEYGITDFRGMLKRLSEMKREREEEIAEFVTQISALKHIEVDDDDCATIELDMDLKDPTSKIFVYKFLQNGVMVPFTEDEGDELKHSLKQVGKKYIFRIKKLGSEDAGLYSVDVGGVNVFSTDFKPEVDFAVKIQEVKAEEREDALFQCVLTAPMSEVKWYGKSALLSNSEKHEITVSEDKLIHKLIVRDCMPLDAGIYAAVAGIKSCNNWLVVEDKDPANKGKKAAKFTLNMPESKVCNLECPPKFLVPLKMHTAPQGYECYMSCAIKGDPTPHVTWLRNGVSLNTNTNYFISNTCGVCSLLILRVGPKDMGEYKIVVENSIGRAECSTKLTVR